MNIKIANRRLIIISGITLSLILSLSTVSCVKNTKSNNVSQLNKPAEKPTNSEKHLVKTADEKEVFVNIDVMPQFPGGEEKMLEFINNNIKYPNTESCVQGRVIVRFVVTKTGSIENIEVVRSLEPSFDKEAVRVIKLMPKWIPGKLNGENASVWFTLPINFRIE